MLDNLEHRQLKFQSLVGSIHTTQLNIKKFYMVLTLLWVFCTDLRIDSYFCLIQHNLIGFYTVVESVYSAVRMDSLYEAHLISSLKS